MISHLNGLLAYCGPDGIALPFGLLLAGLVGSVMHCAPMCGPFVLAQTADRLARVPVARLCEMSRVSSAVLLPYHCGRLLTYMALGAAAGQFVDSLHAGRLPGLLLLVGAMLFLAMAVDRLVPALVRGVPGWPAAPTNLIRSIGSVAKRLDRGSWTGGLLLGVVLGFLPCGFLYAALAVAAGRGSAWGGAVAMLLFGLGTVPSLVVVGLVGSAAGRLWNGAVARLAPAVMLANAVLLGVVGWQQMAGI